MIQKYQEILMLWELFLNKFNLGVWRKMELTEKEKLAAKEVMSKKPSYIIENEDGTFTIKTRHRDYTMKELSGEEVEKCEKLSDNTNVEIDVLLASRSIVDEDITDATFNKIPGSDYFKLKMAVAYIYGMNDFL